MKRMDEYTCGECGVKGEVPFPIDSTRPFYCRSCLAKRRQKRDQR
ncbi:MAG: CxxC-x17-CxxC domain-containing protein [Candidatus Bathyarchaeia archaeon]